MKSLILVLLGLVAYASADCNILERLKVKRQWSQAFGTGGARQDFGLTLWTNLFALAPEARALFSGVNGDNEFSDEFKAHSQRVLGGLDMSISLLDDEATLNAQLAHLKMQHDDRGIAADNFDTFRFALGKALAKTLGRSFAKEAWDNCYEIIKTGITG